MVAMLDVLHLKITEILQKAARLSGVVPIAIQFSDALLLFRNVSLALGNVPLGFFRVAKLHRAVHAVA